MAIVRYNAKRDAHFIVPRWRVIFMIVSVALWVALYELQRAHTIGLHSRAGVAIGVLLGWPSIILGWGALVGSYNATDE